VFSARLPNRGGEVSQSASDMESPVRTAVSHGSDVLAVMRDPRYGIRDTGSAIRDSGYVIRGPLFSLQTSDVVFEWSPLPAVWRQLSGDFARLKKRRAI